MILFMSGILNFYSNSQAIISRITLGRGLLRRLEEVRKSRASGFPGWPMRAVEVDAIIVSGAPMIAPASASRSCARPWRDAVKEPELIAEAEKAQVDRSWRSPEGLERITAARCQT